MRVVIVGADGLIGNGLHANLCQRGHSVLGTTRKNDQAGQKDRIFLDLAEPSPAVPPADVAIICAALSKFAECRNYPDEARQVNVVAPLAIAQQIHGHGGRTLLLSSSAVFDCLSSRRMADEPTAPRSTYGRMKAEAEAGILALGGIVLRLTKV